jgi:hypothetical protein
MLTKFQLHYVEMGVFSKKIPVFRVQCGVIFSFRYFQVVMVGNGEMVQCQAMFHFPIPHNENCKKKNALCRTIAPKKSN